MLKRRTDLALEAAQLWQESAGEAGTLPGVESEESIYYCASRAFSDAQQSVVCLTTSSHVIFPCAYSRR